MALCNTVGLVEVPTLDFVHAVTYTMNYAPDRGWYVGHLWSLAVEEQFYKLWPFAVVVAGMRGAWRVAFAVIWIVPLLRIAESIMWPEHRAMIGETFETTADALAIGCLLALAREPPCARRWYRTVVESTWMIPLLPIAGLAIGTRFRPNILLGQTVVNVAIAMGIDRSVRFPGGSLGTLLNSRC